MKKNIFKVLMLASLISLISVSGHALTTSIRDGHVVFTASSISTTTTDSVSDTFPLGRYDQTSFQCVWASVTGTQPQFKLQVTNDTTNWDDVAGAATVTTGGSGSSTWLFQGLPSRQARVKISTASTAGTLVCTAIGQGG